MGLIKELVLLPASPLRFTMWVAERVNEEAEQQHYSAGAGVQQLEEIEEARDRGELDEDEAARREGEILERQIDSPAEPKGGS
jgi:hypothetical protein